MPGGPAQDGLEAWQLFQAHTVDVAIMHNTAQTGLHLCDEFHAAGETDQRMAG